MVSGRSWPNEVDTMALVNFPRQSLRDYEVRGKVYARLHIFDW